MKSDFVTNFDFYESNNRTVIFEKHNDYTISKDREKFEKKVFTKMTDIVNEIQRKPSANYVVFSPGFANLFQQNLEEENNKI